LENQIYSRLLMLQATGNLKDMKIMAWSTFEGISYISMFLGFGLSFINYFMFLCFWAQAFL